MSYLLYQLPPLGDQESASPFCVKVRRVLRHHRLPFRVREIEAATEVAHLNPASTVPVLVHDGGAVSDSSVIVRWLDTRHAERSLVPSDPAFAAQMNVLEDWADESLYWYLLYYRWRVDDNWHRGRSALCGNPSTAFEWLSARRARRRMLKKLVAHGIGRKAADDVRRGFETLLDALDPGVDEGFLLGDGMTLADIAVAAPLWGLSMEFTPDAAELIRRRRHLRHWLERVDAATRAEEVKAA